MGNEARQQRKRQMTKIEALAIAKENFKAHTAAEIEEMFGRGPKVDDSQFGYRHGWYRVGEYNFCTTEVTGQAYDNTQGGWAFI